MELNEDFPTSSSKLSALFHRFGFDNRRALLRRMREEGFGFGGSGPSTPGSTSSPAGRGGKSHMRLLKTRGGLRDPDEVSAGGVGSFRRRMSGKGRRRRGPRELKLEEEPQEGQPSPSVQRQLF